MFEVQLNRALNKEIKYYGLSYLGLIGAMMIGCGVWLRFGMTIGIMGFAIGYIFAAHIAKSWHLGEMQRFMYWHLPVGWLFGSKYLPKSYESCLL